MVDPGRMVTIEMLQPCWWLVVVMIILSVTTPCPSHECHTARGNYISIPFCGKDAAYCWYSLWTINNIQVRLPGKKNIKIAVNMTEAETIQCQEIIIKGNPTEEMKNSNTDYLKGFITIPTLNLLTDFSYPQQKRIVYIQISSKKISDLIGNSGDMSCGCLQYSLVAPPEVSRETTTNTSTTITTTTITTVGENYWWIGLVMVLISVGVSLLFYIFAWKRGPRKTHLQGYDFEDPIYDDIM
ncbi:hypothetical protein Hamer_G008804 [Homarus americanus]|uniref:Uncharacterized protein n=1 Tax=Homarus americanus TaxID=6706 RepID=A0A8J5JML8_HOMAM|nr:hypothetical protein Hamer_G008804 [Homarus americanus]